ncbi:uncharacterized protein [Euwallacea similis]|uniref:uncharacterized protein n=1 Tax=Euwallacea similis TaxID=1736056 RepID=UPI00344E8FAD
MAFVSLILTAQILKKQKKALIEEKLQAIKADEELNRGKKFRFRHIGVDLKEAVKRFYKRIISREEGSCGYKTCFKLGHEGSCENYVLKSVLGFVAGVILTYFLYIVFIFQLNIELTTATLICSVLGCVLTIGLAFSTRVRCIVLLALPQFFSKRGRQALLAYAFVLALTGPTRNIVNNLGILSESLACGQEQLKQAVKQIIDVIKKPFLAIKEAIKKVVKTVKEVVKKIKEILMKIKRIVMSIVRVIKSTFEFLGKIINICNKELGTPFERCTRVFENAIADCNASLGPLFNWLCSLSYIVKAVCYIVKIFDYVCMMVDFLSNSVVGVIIRKIKTFVRHIKTMFYVRIRFSHSFKYKTVSSKSVTQIAKEIVAEIKDRSRNIVAFFNFMTLTSMLFFMYLIFQVVYYRFRYLTSERFDNVYITKYFREIDKRRAKFNKETVLPLTRMEKTMYVSMRSESLSKTERRNLLKNTIKLVTVCVNLGTHMAADYSLHWMLSLISHHARYQSKVEAPNLPMAHVSGEGFLAMLLQAIVNAFQPVGLNLEIDTVPCLPIPIPPDLDRYTQIAITVGICWILTVLEPYGLRFRNYIMGYYHPLRAKQRAIWLYNHILRSRTTFLLLARRKLRRKFGMKSKEDEIGYKEWLRSHLRYGILRICLGGDLQLTCLLCGQVFREKDKSKFVRCSTPQCPGLFCLECFEDLKNICPVCLSPVEYGDLDEFQEKDSSDDEPLPDKAKKKPRKCPKWFPCGKSKDNDEEPLNPQEDLDERRIEMLYETDKEFLEEHEEEKEQVTEEESDSSTDYSYSYQYEVQKELFQPESIAWRDIEMQAMAEEVSMKVFDDKKEFLGANLDNQIRVPEGHTALIRIGVTASQEEVATDATLMDLQIIAEDSEDVECQCSSSSRRAELIGVPRDGVHKKVYCTCSDSEELGSTISSSTRSDCKFCKCSGVEDRSAFLADTETKEELREIVPRLDLSCLEEKRNCDNPVLSNRFSYVSYQEVCECHSGRSLDSYSLPSNLGNSSSEVQQRTKNVRTCSSASDSPNSMDSYEFNKILRKKVRRCYKRSRIPCENRQCQHNEKKSSIADMFKKIIPKRNKGKNYLPLHNRDLEELVQGQSQNYNERDLNPLTEDTNDSPTYPFGSSSGSEEEQALLGRNRIRGGQCTCLVDSNLQGRQDPANRIRSFDANSQSKLKDFITLSLPPRLKLVSSKEVISLVLFNIEELKGGNSMPADDEDLLIEREESSNCIISREAVESAFSLHGTPLSSDSGLSETICIELLGNSYLKELAKTNGEESGEVNLNFEGVGGGENIGEEKSASLVELINTANWEDNVVNQSEKEESVSTVSLQTRKGSEQVLRSKRSNSCELRSSKESLKSKAPNNPSQPSTKFPGNRKSSKLNELLYKYECTEINLAQKLSLVILQINLHSSIIPEAQDVQKPKVIMRSPRRRDKIVETNCSFPLHQDWNCKGRSRKLVLTSDKTQQTSEHNFYGNRGVRSTVSDLDEFEQLNKTSAVYYFSDLQKKDVKSTSPCKCSICVIAQSHRSRSESAEMCNCCRCNKVHTTNTPKAAIRRIRSVYQATEYLPNSSDTQLSERLSPPPMRTEPPRRTRPPNCRRAYTQHCGCFYHSFRRNNDTENYVESSTPYRYCSHNFYYYYLQRCDQRNKQVLDDLPYQNNEYYLQLVHELQDILHSRNRKRVKRTMQEFENKSKQNKPLERPIINYDETSESEEPILRKIDQIRRNIKACCTENRCNYCAEKKKGKFEGVERRRRFGGEPRQGHWTMNSDSGNWQKKNLKRKGRREPSNKDEFQQCDCSCNCGHRYQ